MEVIDLGAHLALLFPTVLSTLLMDTPILTFSCIYCSADVVFVWLLSGGRLATKPNQILNSMRFVGSFERTTSTSSV